MKILETDQAVSDEGRYNLACVLALGIAPARADAQLTAAERETVAESYATRAVAILLKLRMKGYFKNAENAAALRTDSDLQPLRARPDFQRLLSEGLEGND